MRGFVLSLLGVVLATLPANSQTLRFEETVVVTATGEATPLADVSSAVTVFDLEELQEHGQPSVSEVLRLVPGATLLRSGLDGGVASLFVRGVGSNQTLVLLDGIRLNSPYFGGYDWSVPLASGLDRVEVVRGPYSALYGADALGGVVQLVPARPSGTTFRLLGEGGGSSWRRGELGFATAAGGLALRADLAYRAGEGPIANDDFAARLASVYLTWEGSAATHLGLLVRRTASETEIPFSGATATPHRRTATDETVVALPVRLRALAGGELEAVLSRVERSLAFRDPDDPWGFVASDTTADSTSARAVWHRPVGPHRVSVGGEWRRDEVNDVTSYGTNLDAVALTTASAFVQDRVQLGRRWEVLAGLRWDEARPWGREISPRLTVTRRAGPLRLWGSWGRAFRAPSLGELYFPFSGNPELLAERSRAAEAGAAMAVADGRGLVQLVGFANRVSNLIEFEYATYAFANVGRASSDGVELSWVHHQGPLRLRAGVTWLDARDGEGHALLRRPDWSGHLSVGGRSAAGVGGEVTLVWVGPRVDVDAVSFARVEQGGFVTASVASTVPLGGGIRLRLRVDNLADRRYQEVNGYPALGRRVIVGAEFARP